LDVLFAITDIETTGSHASANSITEIAVVLTDGKVVQDTFTTLIRPDHYIPDFITSLTGITNEMVEHAPTFQEVSAELITWFEDAVFVAHNVGFDYAFIKKAFADIGVRFNPQKLCTVRMSRKIIPGHQSYSLGKICSELGIGNDARHRALGDTMATVELFHHLMMTDQSGIIDDMLKRNSTTQWLPNKLSEEVFEGLPEKEGVYYMLDTSGKVLYIGMSINIKKRIRQHSGGKMESKRRQEFITDVAHIDTVETGTELIARLLEDAEIRKHWPPHNKAQKRPTLKFGLLSYQDGEGFTRLAVQKIRPGIPCIRQFYSNTEAREWLFKASKTYNLHSELCNLTPSADPKPSVDIHNAAVDQMIQELKNESGRMIIEGKGRSSDEKSFVLFERNELKGYAHIPFEESITSFDDFEIHLIQLPQSEMTESILRANISNYKVTLIDE
jgi:DNA polymerase-3 subunit epsilon